MSDELGWT